MLQSRIGGNTYKLFASKNDPIVVTATGAPYGISDHVNKYVQTIGTSLVYKFNWPGL